MTKEELIKNQFPNDEFLQSAVSQIVDKCTVDLQSECRTCVYTDSPCVRSDYPSKDGVCSHYKNVFDENAELREKLNFSTQYYQGEKAKEQLTKAKEIIKTFLGFAEAFGYSPSIDKFISDTEQFLSEGEK